MTLCNQSSISSSLERRRSDRLMNGHDDDDDDDGVTGAGPEAGGTENDSSYESSYSLMSESDDVSCDNIVSASSDRSMVNHHSTFNRLRVTSDQCMLFIFSLLC